jgi:peptidyl-prolyl cis-trans isomerase C
MAEPGGRDCSRTATSAGHCDRHPIPDTDDDATIGAAVERLLVDEVRVPSSIEAECRRYYENHLLEFQSGDLVYARHILFQVTPSVSVPEIRARAERALAELLAELPAIGLQGRR